MQLNITETIPSSSLTAVMDTKKEKEAPKSFQILPGALFRKQLLLSYQQLSLPISKTPRKYLILNQIAGGYGDIAAAGATINIILKMDPTAIIHWSTGGEKEKALQFLPKETTVQVSGYGTTGFEPNESLDVVLYGPLSTLDLQDQPYIRKKFLLKENTNMLFFQEIGTPARSSLQTMPKPTGETKQLNLDVSFIHDENEIECCLFENDQEVVYSDLDRVNQMAIVRMFANSISSSSYLSSIAMNLDDTSGVFIHKTSTEADEKEEAEDRVSIQAKALDSIQDKLLKEQLLHDSKSFREFCKEYSIAFGYAHYTYAKERLIDFYAIQEKKKNVAVILVQNHKENEEGVLDYFRKRVFTTERLNLLKQNGYGKVVIKNETDKAEILIEGAKESKRTLLVVLRERLKKEIMTIFQRVSNAQLTTGDNSACEVFAHADKRCFEFYMYEDISTSRGPAESVSDFSGCKGQFLDQQIKLATAIYAPLGELLVITSKEKEITKELMDRAAEILSDPKIPESLNRFAEKIRNEYDFHPIMEGMIKRHLWLQARPGMLKVEEDAVRDSSEVQKTIETYYFLEPGKDLLPEMGKTLSGKLVKALSSTD